MRDSFTTKTARQLLSAQISPRADLCLVGTTSGCFTSVTSRSPISSGPYVSMSLPSRRLTSSISSRLSGRDVRTYILKPVDPGLQVHVHVDARTWQKTLNHCNWLAMRSREGNLDFEEVYTESVAQSRIDPKEISELLFEACDQISRHLTLWIVEVFVERNTERHRQQKLRLSCIKTKPLIKLSNTLTATSSFYS